MTDERRGLPSISGLERLALCPGSWTLSQYVDVLYEAKGKKNNIGAESGNKIHAALSGEEVELSRFEGWTKERCEEYEMAVLAQLKEEYGFNSNEFYREERYEFHPSWAKSREDVIATGRVDVLYVDRVSKQGLVIDYKTGSIGAGVAELNYQMTGYAVVAFQQPIGAETIFIALIQPNAPEKISVATLTVDDYRLAEKAITEIITKATSGTTERHADIEKQCKYCPAKGFCPEFLTAANKAAVTLPGLEIAVTQNAKILAEDIIATAPIEDVVKIYEMRSVLQTILEAIPARIKRQLSSNPESVPGYELASSGAVRSLPDLDAALNSIKDLMSAKEFKQLLSISIPELEAEHKKRSGLKGEAAKNDFAVRFDDLIIKTPKELMIRKKKA